MPTLRMEGTTVDDDEVINEEEELGIDEEKVMVSGKVFRRKFCICSPEQRLQRYTRHGLQCPLLSPNLHSVSIADKEGPQHSAPEILLASHLPLLRPQCY